MNTMISLRLPEGIVIAINKIASDLERPKTYVVRKALERYLSEFADYQIALDRMKNKDDEIISSKEMRAKLDI